MGNKYRSPFVFDGRAAALLGAGADAGDTICVYDADADETKTISIAELAAAVSANGAGGWIPAPTLPAEHYAADSYTVQAADAGVHKLFYLDNTNTPASLVMDFDLLPDGEWFHATFTADDDNFQGLATFVVTPSGTLQFGGWGTPTAPPASYDSLVFQTSIAGAVTMSFYRDGSEIKAIGAGTSANLSATYGP